MGQTQEVTLTVVGAEVVAEHPELHHYTGEAGLAGIVRSGGLWATNYEDLNDSSEVTHLRERLEPELEARFRKILRRRRLNSKINTAIEQSGGLNKCARDLASDLLRSFYKSTFEPMDESPVPEAIGTPYIASLCTHTYDEYEAVNGLLSQWRGYGGKAGFCIVFDTKRLADLLGHEYDAFGYTHLNLSPAHYAVPSVSMATLFPGLVDCCEEFVETALNRRPTLNDGIEQFMAAATLVKHQAFREEREVRVVAIPISDSMRRSIAEEYPDEVIRESRPEKQLGAPGKRYIELFRGNGQPLPIKRVIVGPSLLQDDGMKVAEGLSAGRFEVVRSDTPFKG